MKLAKLYSVTVYCTPYMKYAYSELFDIKLIIIIVSRSTCKKTRP